MKTAALLFLLAITLSANTITFVNAPTGQTGPYNLLEDARAIQGTCISWNLLVAPPYTWEATEYRVADFSDPMRTELLEAAWLNTQFAVNPDTVSIHQAIWDLFGATYTDSSTLQWERRAEQNYGSIDPYGFYLLVPNQANFTQSFLVQEGVPEPMT